MQTAIDEWRDRLSIISTRRASNSMAVLLDSAALMDELEWARDVTKDRRELEKIDSLIVQTRRVMRSCNIL